MQFFCLFMERIVTHNERSSVLGRFVNGGPRSESIVSGFVMPLLRSRFNPKPSPYTSVKIEVPEDP